MSGIPGIQSGFIRFNTAAHLILVYMHEHGDACLSDLVEQGCGTTANVAMALTKLARAGFIRARGKVSKFATGHCKTQMRYSLNTRAHMLEYTPSSDRERGRRYKQAKRARVSSVFEFRGKIQLGAR